MNAADVVIIKALLESNGHYVSGNTLARALGISRVGVCARLEKLRESGFLIEAVRHRGYRLKAEPLELSASLVQAYLESWGQSMPIYHHEIIDSTNAEAERVLTQGNDTPFSVISQQQTSGRGRLGRVWHSPQEGNLYLSLAFKPQSHPTEMQSITLWMGLSVCEAIASEFDLDIRLKWPNDLLYNEKKLAGMLTEAKIEADRMNTLIFGLGLNVNSDCSIWPEDLSKKATSLSRALGKEISLNKLAAKLIAACKTGYDAYLSQITDDHLLEMWNRYDCLKGREVTADYRGDRISGVVEGLEHDGSLMIKTSAGEKIILRSGEVTLTGLQREAKLTAT